MMLVANSFDLWKKDAFFSAAEEVQQSADIMESMYRMWVRGRREGQELEYSHELRRDLQIALGTAKWQLDEFERAVQLSHGYRSQDNTTSRHKQFVDCMEDQISRVERALRESLAEEKQPLRWVDLDEEESDDLEAFLSGTSGTSQSSNDGSVDLGPFKSNNYQGDQVGQKDVASLEGDLSDCIKSYKEVVPINKDKYFVELEAKETPRTCDDMDCQAEKFAGYKRTWSSPDFGSWKIVIADEDDKNKTLQPIVESTTRGKGSNSSFWKQKGGEHLQTKGGRSNCLDLRGINRFTKLFKRMSGVQRQLQGPQYIQFRRFLQVMPLLMLTIFLIGKLFNIAASTV